MSANFKNISLALLTFNVFLANAITDIYVQKAREIFQNITIDDPNVFSCSRRCNNLRKDVMKIICGCDALCFVYRDCCEDIDTMCPLVVQEGQDRNGNMVNLELECLESGQMLAIAGCHRNTNQSKSFEHRESLIEYINNAPVTDKETNLVYANIDIYNCNVANGSGRSVLWPVIGRYNQTLDNNWVINVSQFVFYSWFYSPPAHVTGLRRCKPKRVSLCQQSISSQLRCQSFVPYLLLKNLIQHPALCKECQLNLTDFSIFESFNDGKETALTSMKDGKIIIETYYFRKVICDMPKDTVINGTSCHIAECPVRSGFYLNRDGTCRKIAALLIKLPDAIENIKEDLTIQLQILHYVTRSLQNILSIKILATVTPIMKLFDPSVNKSVFVATFIQDFNAAPAEDFIYFHYKAKLFMTMSAIERMVQSNTTQYMAYPNKSIIKFDWNDSEVAKYQGTALQSWKIVSWCSYEYGFNKSRLISFPTLTFPKYKNEICLCRVLSDLRGDDARWCIQRVPCAFHCFVDFFKNTATQSLLVRLEFCCLLICFVIYLIEYLKNS